MDAKWKRFEDLAAHIQRALSPAAKVEQNVRVVGRTSGVERQIDIAVRTRVGQFELLVVIDCKDYKANVDVKDVEAFASMLKDVEANKGALIAAKGFSEAARNVAKHAGISLYTLVDAESEDWPAFVTIPVLVDDRHLEAVRYQISSTELRQIRATGIENTTIFREDGTRVGPLRDLASRHWNEGRLPTEQGLHENLSLSTDPVYLEGGHGRLALVNVTADIRVKRTLYFGHLPLVSVQGLQDAHTGELHTKSMTTDWLEVAQVRESWEVVASEEALAVRPVMTVVEHTYFALEGER